MLVGDIAPSATRHEDLRPRLPGTLDYQQAEVTSARCLRREDARGHSRRAAAGNHDVEHIMF